MTVSSRAVPGRTEEGFTVMSVSKPAPPCANPIYKQPQAVEETCSEDTCAAAVEKFIHRGPSTRIITTQSTRPRGRGTAESAEASIWST